MNAEAKKRPCRLNVRLMAEDKGQWWQLLHTQTSSSVQRVGIADDVVVCYMHVYV